jgi:hypothetical protein
VVVVSSIVLVALKLTSRSFFFLATISCRVVLFGSVALGRALGEILPPKDSGLGRLQLVVVGMALRLSSCRFGASLDVAAFHPRSWQALSPTSCRGAQVHV